MLGPTAAILVMAQKAPGGVIRWCEARDEYLAHSEAAKRDERKANRLNQLFRNDRKAGNRQYHMSLHQVLKRHFAKVQGTDGYYVLKHLIVGDREGDELDVDLSEWERP